MGPRWSDGTVGDTEGGHGTGRLGRGPPVLGGFREASDFAVTVFPSLLVGSQGKWGSTQSRGSPRLIF